MGGSNLIPNAFIQKSENMLFFYNSIHFRLKSLYLL